MNVTDAMVHAYSQAYDKNWEAQLRAPEDAPELGTFFAMRAGLQAALASRQPVGEPVGRVMTDFVHWHGERPVAGTDLYAAPPAQAVDLAPSIPSELAPVVAALNRFDECAEDCDSEGCDIGRDWLDALTTMGLLKRTQRSPAVWTMTADGERLLALINSKAVGNG